MGVQSVPPRVAEGRRRAIVICNARYDDPALPRIPGAIADHDAVTRVLQGPAAGFEVTPLLDEGLLGVRLAIARVCREVEPDDTLLFYYSGGSFVGDGALHLPVKDSRGDYPAATMLEPEFVLREMRASRCRRIVILVDGCHSGAFFQHNRGIPDGLFAITACGADQITPDTPDGGLFTRAVLEALEGADTDRDGDGRITIDDVHDYVAAKFETQGQNSTPMKWVWNVREPIYLTSAPPRVFLSYRRDDLELATRIKAGLERRGFSIWFDRQGVSEGNWKQRVIDGLVRARALVVLLTPSFVSGAVQKELEFAAGEHVPIIPVTAGRIAQGALPDWYRFDYASLHRHEIELEAIERGLDVLAAAIRSTHRERSREQVG